MRVGCLWIPELPLVSLLRAEPELATQPLAVVEPGPSGQAQGNTRVLACTEAAQGVEAGMTLSASQAVCPALLVRTVSAERVRAAAQAALEAAASVSPRLEEAAPGLVFLDLEGLSTLFPGPDGERSVAQTLAAAAEGVGLRAAVGIAEGKTAARLAARAAAADLDTSLAAGHAAWSAGCADDAPLYGDGADGTRAGAEGRYAHRIGPPRGPARDAGARDLRASATGQRGARGVQRSAPGSWVSAAYRVVSRAGQRAFLAALPLTALEPSAELLLTLRRFGLSTLGELSRLPLAAAAARLGPEGAALQRLARGEDPAWLVPQALPERHEEGEELEWEATSLEPLLFVWKSLLDRLAARLSARGLAAAELWLLLRLGSGAWDERAIALAAPTREVGPLLSLLRLELEARPCGEPVRAVRIAVRPARERLDQLSLFGPRGASPAQLEAAVARLSALLGKDRVGQPVPLDAHRPFAAAACAFAPPSSESLPPAQEPPDAEAPLSARALRPPRAAEVRCDGQGRPSVISDGGRLGGKVVGSAGPFRTLAEWWTPTPLALDTFDLEVQGGLLLRASRELQSGAWWIEAIYD